MNVMFTAKVFLLNTVQIYSSLHSKIYANVCLKISIVNSCLALRLLVKEATAAYPDCKGFLKTECLTLLTTCFVQ